MDCGLLEPDCVWRACSIITSSSHLKLFELVTKSCILLFVINISKSASTPLASGYSWNLPRQYSPTDVVSAHPVLDHIGLSEAWNSPFPTFLCGVCIDSLTESHIITPTKLTYTWASPVRLYEAGSEPLCLILHTGRHRLHARTSVALPPPEHPISDIVDPTRSVLILPNECCVDPLNQWRLIRSIDLWCPKLFNRKRYFQQDVAANARPNLASPAFCRQWITNHPFSREVRAVLAGPFDATKPMGRYPFNFRLFP
jgi:hypothetical protein